MWRRYRKNEIWSSGCNHPVKDLATGKIELTSQNHGYAVDEESIEDTDLEVTHIALNDGTVEGLKTQNYPCIYCSISIQKHHQDQKMQTIYLTIY